MSEEVQLIGWLSGSCAMVSAPQSWLARVFGDRKSHPFWRSGRGWRCRL